MFNISCHVHIITSKQMYCKIGHIDGIEQMLRCKCNMLIILLISPLTSIGEVDNLYALIHWW